MAREADPDVLAAWRRPAAAVELCMSWPIVRRDYEFETVQAALAEHSEVGGIIIIGDPGVGKSTLARMVTQAMPVESAWIAGTESARDIPLGAFARFLGETASPDTAVPLSCVRKVLDSKRYSIIGVDDAHLLDDSSATLLHELILDGSVRIIATAPAKTALPGAVVSLWKNERLRWFRLTPFTKHECVELVEKALGGRIDGLSAQLIWDSTGGNALFVRHLVAGALDAQALTRVGLLWHLRGDCAVTSELVSLLDQEIGKLSGAVLHTLQMLAFCEPLEARTLSESAGHQAIEEAENRGLILVDENSHGAEVRLRSPVFGEVVRRRLGTAAQRRVRAELVNALQRQPVTTHAERMWLAQLSVEADEDADAALLVGAARDALALCNRPLGERLAREAVRRGGGLAASEVLAWALHCQGNATEADQILRSFNPDQLTEPELVRWGAARITILQWWLDDAPAAEAVRELVQARLTSPRLRLFMDACRSSLLLYQNKLDDAVALAEEVIASAQAPPKAILWAVSTTTYALALMGCGNRARAIIARAPAVEQRLGGLLQYPVAYGEVSALTLLGDLDAAAQRAAGLMRISSADQQLAWGMANILAGTVDLARGRFADIVTRLEDTVAVLRSEPATFWLFPAQLLLAQAYAVRQNVEVSRRMLASLRAQFGCRMAVFEPQLRTAEAWLAAAEGDVSGAVSVSRDAARLARTSHQQAIEMLALHDAIRFGDISCARRLAELTDGVDGRLAAAIGAHARAVLRHDAGAIYAAAKQFEDIGALLRAADAAAQAAAAFEESDEQASAVEANATARRLAISCGEITSPAVAIASRPLPLTSREREIGRLVASGLTNTQIAEKLLVSVRTVEGHIYRASGKVGVSDRNQLADMIINDRMT